MDPCPEGASLSSPDTSRETTMVIRAAAAAFAAALSVMPASADDRASCEAARGSASVQACSRILSGGGAPDLRGQVLFKRGLAYARSGNHRLALSDFERSSALRPDDADARNNVAAMKLRLGRGEDAKADLRREVARDPANARADRSLRAIEALDDYDAQLARRQREVEAELREMRRRTGGR